MPHSKKNITARRKTKRTPRAKRLTLQEQMLQHMEDAINLQSRNAEVMELNFAKFAVATDRNAPWRVTQRQVKAREQFLDTLTKAFRHYMERVAFEFEDSEAGTHVRMTQRVQDDAKGAASQATSHAYEVTFRAPVS